MLGIWFLLMSFWLGYVILLGGEKWIKESVGIEGFSGKKVEVSVQLVLISGGFLVGTMTLGWLVYLGGLLLSTWIENPLWMSNLIILGVVSLKAGWWLKKRIKKIKFRRGEKWDLKVVGSIGTITGLFFFLFYYTFRVENGNLLVGPSVFSDFGPHLAIIRSFSLGNNFPTIYPHFPLGDIKYHFMFDFLVGNLEFLGMRVDHAFNGLSLLVMLCFLILLYSLTAVMSGKRGVGILTLFLWLFRSSPAAWKFLYESLGEDFLSKVLGVSRFIGETKHEDWGLWNQNVYLNQRHLVFGWGLLILILILLLPLWMKKESFFKRLLARTIGRPKMEMRRVLLLGLMLGSLGFWNGAAVISGGLILLVMMLTSKNKGEYLGILLLAGILIYLQKSLFTEGEVVEPRFLLGFLAEERTAMGVIRYWVELLGVWWLLLPASLMVVPRKYWNLMLGFSTPLIFANLVSLTPDIAVNHKYVMSSVMLLNIFVAYYLVVIAEKRGILGKLVSGGLMVILMITGVIDLVAIFNINKSPFTYEQRGEFFEFIKMTDKKSVFMVDDMPVSNPVLLSGRAIYFGWPYFAWSAGYDTDGRDVEVKEIYATELRAELEERLEKTEVEYVVYRKEELKNVKIAERSFLKVFEDERRIVFEVR